MGFIKRAWHGDIKLWKIFWLFGILLPVLFNMVLFGALIGVMGFMGAMSSLMSGIWQIVFMPYAIWWMVSTWRAAFNCKFRLWGYLARIWVALGVIGLVAQVAISVTSLMNNQSTVASMAQVDASIVQMADDVVAQKAAKAQQCDALIASMAADSGVDVATYREKNVAPGWMEHCIKNMTITSPAPAAVTSEIPVTGSAPAEAPAVVPEGMTPEFVAEHKCKEKLINHANKSGADPIAYLEQNQAWIQECVKKAVVTQ